MLPLVPLALSFVPELIRIIAGDRAGGVAGRVAGVVHAVTGTDDPAEAQRKLAEDPALAGQLRIRLAEIALESQRAADLAAEQKRQAELATLQKTLENTQGARTSLIDLVRSGSPIAWGAPIVSVIVTVGFFAFLMMLMWGGIRTGVDATVTNIVNIAVGALATAFATVVNFWLGSSQGSRVKDEQVSRLQAATIDIVRTPPSAPVAVEVTRPTAPDGDRLFDQCLAVVLDKEGGFVDHPADRGGPTNLGITLRTLADWKGLAHDELSPEGRERLVAELRGLSRREAAEIYRANYWLPMRCGDLPPGIALMLFDFGVTAGPRTAVKLLQRAVGVTDDGSVGPVTLAAVKAQDAARLLEAMVEARLAFYQSLPNAVTFGEGWANRTRQVAALAEALRA